MLNQVCIAGNLGADPDIRFSQSGLAIANLNIAVNEHFKNANGEPQKRTHWFRATAFGRTAEIAGEYLKKGSKVGIGGKLVQRTWQDDQGNNRSSVEIRIDQLELLGNGNSNGSQNDGRQQQTPSQQSGQQASAGNQRTSRSDAYEPPPDDLPPPSEDIPF